MQHNKSHPGSRNASQDGGVRARAFTHERADPAHARRKLRRKRAEGGGEGGTQEGENACPFTEPRGDSSPGETL